MPCSLNSSISSRTGSWPTANSPGRNAWTPSSRAIFAANPIRLIPVYYGAATTTSARRSNSLGVWATGSSSTARAGRKKSLDGWVAQRHLQYPLWIPLEPSGERHWQCHLLPHTCGYNLLFPSNYLGGAGGSTSNDAFKTVANSNFPNGGAAYFTPTTYPAGMFGSTLPPAPGVHRNSLNLPGYKGVDVTLAKGFGFPRAPILGETPGLSCEWMSTTCSTI